jgi:hypothetical protein
MTSTERALLVYGLSLAGAAAVSYARGKRTIADISMDAALHGGLVGTGVNVVWWLYDEQSIEVAKPNQGQEICPPYGKILEDGLHILSKIDQNVLYKAAKLGSFAVGPAPDDPNIVVLPAE